jgi:Tol biopolymer transport system component
VSPRRVTLVLSLIVALLVAAPAQSAFPGGQGRIAFSLGGGFSGPADSDPTGWFSSIGDIGRSGTGERTLRDCLEHEGDSPAPRCPDQNQAPAYSPDGRLIAFDAGEGLAVMRSDGSRVRLLRAHTDDDGEPAFSPDGRQLVFTGHTSVGGGAVARLYVVSLTTGRVRALAAGRGSQPTWSVRNRVAFVRDGDVYVVWPDGDGLRRITAGLSPDWSPDGRSLVFARHWRLYIRSGGQVRRVKGARVPASNPVWSPEGQRIAYELGESGIWTIGTHGKAPRLVIESQSGDSGATVAGEPTWQPLRRRG